MRGRLTLGSTEALVCVWITRWTHLVAATRTPMLELLDHEFRARFLAAVNLFQVEASPGCWQLNIRGRPSASVFHRNSSYSRTNA